MGRDTTIAIIVCILLVYCAAPTGSHAQEEPEVEEPAESAELAESAPRELLGWSGRTELGLVLTSGNSNAEAVNLTARLKRRRERSLLEFKADGAKSDTADDRFRQVAPGVTWQPGALPPPTFDTFLVDPAIEADVENIFLELLFERTTSAKPRVIPGTLQWHVGSTWERNVEAGLNGRLLLFSGLGHQWWRTADLAFTTRYALSYSSRDEETPDPEKEEAFMGARVAWHYRNRWGPRVVYENDLIANMSLVDTTDYSASMVQSLNVPMSKKLSLVVTLRWTYNNFPALEDIDIVAQAVVRDPDGVPGTGDEFFETVSEGGAAVDIGTTRERKKTLDTVFSTALRITF
jgi:putative salt-induced outer membrane protein YdiY